jgi:hypothetical protein
MPVVANPNPTDDESDSNRGDPEESEEGLDPTPESVDQAQSLSGLIGSKLRYALLSVAIPRAAYTAAALSFVGEGPISRIQTNPPAGRSV